MDSNVWVCVCLCVCVCVCVCVLQQDLSEAAVVSLSRWGALVMQGCAEDQPAEVKLTSAEVLVKAVPTLLTAPALPLGEWTSVNKNMNAGI